MREDLTRYKKTVEFRLGREFQICRSLQGETYDIVAESFEEDTPIFGENYLTSEIITVDFDCDSDYIEEKIDALPETILSGARNIYKNKKTVLIHTFVLPDIPFSLIQKVRSFSFSKNEQKQHKAYVEAGIILVDANSFTIYSNSTAASKCRFFKNITPVETLEDEEADKDVQKKHRHP